MKHRETSPASLSGSHSLRTDEYTLSEKQFMTNYVLRVNFASYMTFILTHVRGIRLYSTLFYCVKLLSDDIRADA